MAAAKPVGARLRDLAQRSLKLEGKRSKQVETMDQLTQQTLRNTTAGQKYHQKDKNGHTMKTLTPTTAPTATPYPRMEQFILTPT